MSESNLEEKKKKANVTIREMAIDDISPVFHLGERLFTSRDVPNLYHYWDEYEVLGAYYDDPEFCFVAESGDELVGFVLGTTIQKRRSAWKYGYLVWMGVEPEYQGQGIGERLFDWFLEIMLDEGVRMILMDTEADNEPALKFFSKLGFGRPEDHVYLSLNLSRKQRKHKEKNGNGAVANYKIQKGGA
jgi:ribosomal protein S18 acetylase RimI-like enzyme